MSSAKCITPTKQEQRNAKPRDWDWWGGSAATAGSLARGSGNLCRGHGGGERGLGGGGGMLGASLPGHVCPKCTALLLANTPSYQLLACCSTGPSFRFAPCHVVTVSDCPLGRAFPTPQTLAATPPVAMSQTAAAVASGPPLGGVPPPTLSDCILCDHSQARLLSQACALGSACSASILSSG